MNSSTYNCCLLLRYFSLGVFIVTFTGCTTFTPVPDSAPSIYIQQKLPFHIAFITSKNLEKRKCSYTTPLQDNFEFGCGLALYEASIATMEKLFKKIYVIHDINQVPSGIDRILKFTVDEFKIIYSHWSMNQVIRLKVSYQITDANNKNRFSSVILVEEHSNSAKYKTETMLASNEYPSSAETLQMTDTLAAFYAGSGPSYDKMIAETINKLLLKMADELIKANRNGEL